MESLSFWQLLHRAVFQGCLFTFHSQTAILTKLLLYGMQVLQTFTDKIFHIFFLRLWLKLLCIALVNCNPIFAQGFSPPEKLNFEHIGEAQGLPQTWVVSIIQDKEGLLWFGTYEGLYKYDGYRATNVADPVDTAYGLRSNVITEIHEDRKGRLWVATFGGGLHQVDKRTGRAITYPIDISGKQVSKWDQLESIYEDRQGVLWLGTNLGIARFDPETHIYKLYPTPNGKEIRKIKEDDSGKLWAGSYRLDPQTGKYTLFPLPTSLKGQLESRFAFHIDAKGIAWMGSGEDGLFQIDTRSRGKYASYQAKEWINKSIHGILEANGYIWLATTEGLQQVDIRTGQIRTYQSDPSQPGSLNTNLLGAGLCLDRSGNLWIGTAYGVEKASLVTKPFEAYQIIPTPPYFHSPENIIFSVLEDHSGTLWVGSAAGDLYRRDSNASQFTHVVINPTKRMTSNWHVWPLLEDIHGQLWVGTGKDLHQLDRLTGKFIRYPYQYTVGMLEKDASGKLWIGGSEEIASFNPVTKQFTYYLANEKDSTSLIPGTINDLMVSRQGEVWVASKRGISRFNPATGKFTRYQTNQYSPKGYLNDDNVLALYEDKDGMIWIGTGQGGLNRLDPKTNSFTYFSVKDGLPSNSITSIIGDEQSNLWLGTNQGLSRFNPKANTFRNFDVGDGLPGNQFVGKGSVYAHKGKLFFGNKDGLVIFHPDSIKDDSTTFPVYITGLTVLEERRPFTTDTLELSYRENFFSLQFAALNYTSPEKNRYAYQLIGVDKNWVQAGSQRVARYTDVAPGKYTFRVKATTDGRVWNKQEAQLTIIIHSPFWKTGWFYTLCGLTVITLFYAGFHYYTAQIRKEERLLRETQQQKAQFEKKISEREMQALRAQMNPHFIFNSLTSIDRFILKNQQEAASDYLSKFSRLIRLILQNSTTSTITLEKELEALALYLEMESLRFKGKFTFQIHCDQGVETEYIEIPPLIIQPYVENAIWHGLMHKQGIGHISIDVRQQERILLCSIEDDGVGRKRAQELKSKSAVKEKSLGMQITAHRLELLNQLQDQQTQVKIVDLVDSLGEPCGTRVELHIPI